MKAIRRRSDAVGRAPRAAGFTIIEVMIVLAVAGLILLLVFEAIPRLERNSRNNQRRQDVQAILEAVSHYELNDSGKFPDNCGGLGHPACTAVEAGSPNDYFLRFSANAQTLYKDPNQVLIRAQTSGSATDQNPVTDANTVTIYNYAICKTTGGGATYYGAGYSDVVALYALESGNGNNGIPQCEHL